MALNTVLRNHVEEFSKYQDLELGDKNIEKNFEIFSGYCVVYQPIKEDTINLDDFSTGGMKGESGSDLGIDSLAYILDGTLIENDDHAEEIFEKAGVRKGVDLKTIIVQSKTTEGFKKSEVLNFLNGVQKILSEPLEDISYVNNSLRKKIAIRDVIDKYATRVQTSYLYLYYATAGSWNNDIEIVEAANTQVNNIKNSVYIYNDVSFEYLDARALINLYKKSKDDISCEFQFENKITLPSSEGIVESYFGNLPLVEYIKIISNGSDIYPDIFDDNVRDYQGLNDVNSSILDTLNDESKRNRFFALNNGVTIVAREMKSVGNKFYMHDYQVVNGCQTSNVLFNFYKDATQNENLDEDALKSVTVPVRIISTVDEEIINSIVAATNSQTQIAKVDLIARAEQQKNLEEYFSAEPNPSYRLYYERRPKQYSKQDIEKVRIINRTSMIRYFGAMFLDEPTLAARFSGKLKSEVGKDIFAENHDPSIYYAAAYAGYRLDFFFRKNRNNDQENGLNTKYKPLKWHMLMAFKYIVSGGRNCNFSESKSTKKYVDNIINILRDDDRCLDTFKKAIDCMNTVIEGDESFDFENKDLNKNGRFAKELKSELLNQANSLAMK